MDDGGKRIVCKYGVKCYQKNAAHHAKYKHPPKRPINKVDGSPPVKKIKIDDGNMDLQSEDHEELGTHVGVSTQCADAAAESDEEPKVEDTVKKTLPAVVDHKEFILKKFLVEMPDDFYQFWEFCRQINVNKPGDALRNVGLVLVGPYDVLADKFCCKQDKCNEDYLIHWRYYYDPPQFQTVIKSDDKNGFHIGYFRDEPEEMPIFLASNSARFNGEFDIVGENVFASVNIYLDEYKKTGDPFKKMHIGKLQTSLKERAAELNLDLAKKTPKIGGRQGKIVARTFNNLGIIVPFNKRTQVGYRELAINNKDLKAILTKIKNALPEQRDKFLDELQPVLTCASIATDECDFGTGIELGLDILAFGIDPLNQTVGRFLANSYNLMDRGPFAKIALAHMKNRRSGALLSIV